MLSNKAFKDHLSTDGTKRHVVSPKSTPFDGTMTMQNWKCSAATFNVWCSLENASRSLRVHHKCFAFHVISAHPLDIQPYNEYITVAHSNNNKLHSAHILKSEDVLAVDHL